MSSIIFLIQCKDQKGLVAGITGFFSVRGFNILHCQQYTDLPQCKFYMRLKLAIHEGAPPKETLLAEFNNMARDFALTWSVQYTEQIPRVAILVSRESHCLYDLLLRKQEGEIRCEFPIIISNHQDLASVAEKFSIPFLHLPVYTDKKSRQENQLITELRLQQIDLIVLARYMQILSPDFIREFDQKIINIHHAFLPAFQGANPYGQAYEQGVKMIGATAHYATAELDAGPIIEQDVERVSHEDAPEMLRAMGRDIERIVLARAVRAHLESRIMVSGKRTIVFSAGV